MSVCWLVCWFVGLLEPPCFLWNYLNFDCIGALLAKYLLDLSDYMSVCLFVEIFALGYLLDLSDYMSVCLFVEIFEALVVKFRFLKIVYLLLF